MDAPAAQDLRVAKRGDEARGELVLAARQRRRAAVAGRVVAGRRVEERHLEPVPLQLLRDLARRHVVRKRALDRAEAGVCGFGEALEERDFGEKKAHVGGKARHARSGVRVWVRYNPAKCAPPPGNAQMRGPALVRRRMREDAMPRSAAPLPLDASVRRGADGFDEHDDGSVETTLGGERVVLFAERALFWPREATLFVADVHLGKAAAFRAGGVPVPRGATAADLARLSQLVARTSARRLVVLGDFLHAAAGRVPALDAAFTRFRDAHADISITVVRGNHDANAGDPPPPLAQSTWSPSRTRHRRSCSATSPPARAPGSRYAATCIPACCSPGQRTILCAFPASCWGGATPSCRLSGA